MRLESPAKINLYLKITGKRPDGFHELDTLMCQVGLYDQISFEKTTGREIVLKSEGNEVPCDQNNLIYKAADLFRNRMGIKDGIEITFKKNIPIGAGMGGGSANAAITLAGLNQWWKLGLPKEKLSEWAGELGSDVAFFLEPSAAVCTGRGEICNPINLDLLARVLLINPGFPVPTPWAYKQYAQFKQSGEPSRWEGSYKKGDDVVKYRLQNDMEPGVFSKYLWLPATKQWLLEQKEVEDAMMSGSGSTMFALLKNKADEEALVARAKERLGDIWMRAVPLITRELPTPQSRQIPSGSGSTRAIDAADGTIVHESGP